MPGLTRQELYDFPTSGRRLLKLATLTEDGAPYVVPLWYDYDGEGFGVAGRREPSSASCLSRCKAGPASADIRATASRGQGAGMSLTPKLSPSLWDNSVRRAW